MSQTTGGVYLSYFKHDVITPALEYIGLAGQRAINQVTGTFLAEGYAGGYTYLRQLGKGPALGACTDGARDLSRYLAQFSCQRKQAGNANPVAASSSILFKFVIKPLFFR